LSAHDMVKHNKEKGAALITKLLLIFFIGRLLLNS